MQQYPLTSNPELARNRKLCSGVCLHTFAQLRSRDASLFSVVTRRLLHPDRKEEASRHLYNAEESLTLSKTDCQ